LPRFLSLNVGWLALNPTHPTPVQYIFLTLTPIPVVSPLCLLGLCRASAASINPCLDIPYHAGYEPGALRVVNDSSGGATPFAGTIGGRLEVCYAGQWGAVCEPNFNDPDARVACRQLGYGFGRAIPANPQPGEGL
jgi:hypothetical protein